MTAYQNTNVGCCDMSSVQIMLKYPNILKYKIILLLVKLYNIVSILFRTHLYPVEMPNLIPYLHLDTRSFCFCTHTTQLKCPLHGKSKVNGSHSNVSPATPREVTLPTMRLLITLTSTVYQHENVKFPLSLILYLLIVDLNCKLQGSKAMK